MKRSTIKVWFLVHKWTSLVSIIFLLLLCITGLPLIFHDEIDALLGQDYEAKLAGPASAQSGLPLDTMLAAALAQRPGEVPLFMAFSNDSPLLTVTTGPRADAPETEMTLLFLDRATDAAGVQAQRLAHVEGPVERGRAGQPDRELADAGGRGLDAREVFRQLADLPAQEFFGTAQHVPDLIAAGGV